MAAVTSPSGISVMINNSLREACDLIHAAREELRLERKRQLRSETENQKVSDHRDSLSQLPDWQGDRRQKIWEDNNKNGAPAPESKSIRNEILSWIKHQRVPKKK